MSIIIKLQGLPLDATSVDVRRYFLGLTIPDGGVHIVGGDEGTVFIEFASDEDARQAMSRGDGSIKNSNIKLLLSSRTEMLSVLDNARQLQQQYLQQLQNKNNSSQNNQNQHFNHQHQQVQTTTNQQLQQSQQSNTANQPPYLASSGVLPMGPALLPTSNSQAQPQLMQQAPPPAHMPFEGDPRMLSQNYQGIISQPSLSSQTQQPPTSQPQPTHIQSHVPSPFVDPRLLSQNYQGLISVQQQPPPQPLLPQNQIFSQFPAPTTTAPSLLGNFNLLGGPDMVGGVGGGTGLNTMLVGGAGGLGTIAHGNMGSGANNNNNNAGGANNRNLSPDNRARMSGMRGGDDKLFANKRCVLAASNIPYRATSKDIIEFLSEFNLKEDCIRRRYNQKGQPTADAKIAFPSPDAAMKALKNMNKKTLCGRPVFLKPV